MNSWQLGVSRSIFTQKEVLCESYTMDSRYISLEDQEEYKMMGNMVFSSEAEGYKFYLDYAKRKGFSVRKCKLKRKDSEIIWRQFVCSCEGYRELKHFERTDRKREPRALTRCGCKAKLEIELNKETGVWFVKEFENQHTHELASPDHVAFLGVHRVMSHSQKAQAVELRMSGLRPFQIMEVMDNNHDELDEVGFVMKDLYNFFTRYEMKNIKGRDAEDVFQYLTSKQEEDAEFFFKYTTDEEGCLRNVFWADAESRIDYGAFGGVVIFDSTYRVNKYNLPFIPFIGVNHHRSTTIFACGILSNESVNSYCWLLETFLGAMRQVHLKSVITDGDLLGMRSNQRSESLNSNLHTLLKRSMTLMGLVRHVKFFQDGFAHLILANTECSHQHPNAMAPRST